MQLVGERSINLGRSPERDFARAKTLLRASTCSSKEGRETGRRLRACWWGEKLRIRGESKGGKKKALGQNSSPQQQRMREDGGAASRNREKDFSRDDWE